MYSPFPNVIVPPATQACTDARHLSVFLRSPLAQLQMKPHSSIMENVGHGQSEVQRSFPLGLSTSDMVYFRCRQGHETDGLMPTPPKDAEVN